MTGTAYNLLLHHTKTQILLQLLQQQPLPQDEQPLLDDEARARDQLYERAEKVAAVLVHAGDQLRDTIQVCVIVWCATWQWCSRDGSTLFTVVYHNGTTATRHTPTFPHSHTPTHTPSNKTGCE